MNFIYDDEENNEEVFVLKKNIKNPDIKNTDSKLVSTSLPTPTFLNQNERINLHKKIEDSLIDQQKLKETQIQDNRKNFINQKHNKRR